MSKSIAMMADEILGGMTATPHSVAGTGAAGLVEGQGELPPISDEARSALLSECMGAVTELDELDLSKPSEETEQTKKKKAEWELKHRDTRKAQSKAASVRGNRLEPGESGRQSVHTTSRGKPKGTAGHRDTRSGADGDRHAQTAKHWRDETERAGNPTGPKGRSATVIPGRGGVKLAKSGHKAAINRSREERGAPKLEGVTVTKTNRTMTLIDASSHRERIANKKMVRGAPMTDAEKAQKRKTYKRKPGQMSSDSSKLGSSVVGQNYESKSYKPILEKKKSEADASAASEKSDFCPKDAPQDGADPRQQQRTGAAMKSVMADTPDEEAAETSHRKGIDATRAKKKAKKKAKAASKLTKEQREIIQKARAILDEMTSVGGIGAGKMSGSSNKAYDTDGKAMGKDDVKIEPVDKSLSKLDKSKSPKKGKKKVAKKKKELKVTKESFENFLSLIVTESQK
tara:strand:+ start:3736 stop:5109 length:1374 start_codon:yes stop_codon:yes gene_type:complete